MNITRLVRAPLALARYLDGSKPLIPQTVGEMYSEVVDQLENDLNEPLKLVQR